ncbi:hypothetical protein ACJJTC_007488 [Scirpophaga incertulas]
MVPNILWLVTMIVFKSWKANAIWYPLVNTSMGLIEGIYDDYGEYSMFMGIPYAHVNTSNPFGAAIPQKPFENIFQAHNDLARCPQIEEFTFNLTGSLDCLHINIYVPRTSSPKSPLPVLVSIHGGHYSIGFSGRYVYGPKFFMRQDIIFVTFNYRLGVYGFMCLDSPEIPGNQGLKDQALALKWIKNNIDAFGGDPNKITVIGVSSGAADVDFHLIFNKEKPFDQAILESGSVFLPIFTKPDKDAPQKLSTYLGVATNDFHEAIAFLASVDPYKIIAASKELNIIVSPCVEEKFEGIDQFIDRDWTHLSVPNVSGMSIILGYNRDEKFDYYVNEAQSYFDKLNVFHQQLAVSFNKHHPNFEEMEKIVQHFYIGDGDQRDMKNKFDIAEFDSDITFIFPMHRTISSYINNNVSQIYHYMFSYVGNRNFAKRRLKLNGSYVIHADEIGYLFDISYMNEPRSAEDQLMIDRLTTLWANFVKYGNPTPETTKLLPLPWKPITKDSPLYCMDINLDMKLMTRNHRKRMAFWELFYKANKDLQI